MQPYFNKVTQAGYDQIAAEIEALKQSRPEKNRTTVRCQSIGRPLRKRRI